uniref:Stress-response A/B barrel domain-containing protein n=1 Tax=Araucaria cunninghamii TaxID=56994 RepID=A0A0D6QRR0_ARACU
MAGESKVIEHIVLFKVKDGAPQEQIDAWLAALNELRSLECVLYLRAGAASAVGAASGNYTHALYGRYSSRAALAQYSAHPRHVAAVQEHGTPIVDDLLALDWEAPDQPGFEFCDALRIALLKPCSGLGEADSSEVVEILSGYGKIFPSIAGVSFGENISPGRAKGFRWGFLCVFRAVKDLEDLNNNEHHVRLHKEKVMPRMEESVMLDCFISNP